MNVKVPQIQFIVRVPDFPVMQQRRVFTVQTVKFRGDSQVLFVGGFL